MNIGENNQKEENMRKLLVAMLILTCVVMTQAGWNYAETVLNFANDDSVKIGGTGAVSGDWFRQSNPHGVVVDAEGKFWVAFHSGYGPDQSGSPEFMVGEDTCHYKPLYVFNADGTPASFSPITVLEFPDGVLDTLYAESYANGSGKGISLDNDGNILYSAWSTVYLINYQTGAGIARFIPSSLGSITEAVQDDAGFIYVGYVVPSGRPIYLLDESLERIGNAVDSTFQITRSLCVKTGTDVTRLYNGTTWNGNGVMVWESENPEFEEFAPVDTIGNLAEYTVGDTTYTNVKLWSSSLDWTPDGNLLVGSLRQSWAGPLGSQWWIMDPVTGEYYDNFGVPVDDEIGNSPWGHHVPGGANGPRGGFFTDATTLYTVDFYLATLDKWTWEESAVDNDVVVVDKFSLKQNFPNPFNPVTTIQYSIAKDADVKLTVYDMLGKEVQTLVNSRVTSGNYQVQFDASNLATGVYIYRLETEGQTLSKKMMFLK